MKLLLIEDDKQTADFILKSLGEMGHSVQHFVDGLDGLKAALAGDHELILADRRLPTMDGLTIVKRLRAASIETPLIFLSTMNGIDDRVEGLDAGADDYLVKPFAFSELRARVDALARRPQATQNHLDHLYVGDLKVDLIKRCTYRDGQQIMLQQREFRLLEYMARNAGRVVTKTMLLEHVWDINFDPKTNIIETHVSRLRSKIDTATGPSLIKTVRGSGYMIDVD